MKPILRWLVLAMASWIPLPERPLHDEPMADYVARRTAIAEDLLAVASDSAEEPLFDGPDARERTALFMASIASFESAYDLEVDQGKRLGPAGEVCIMQVSVDAARTPRGMVTAEGWTRDELAKDRSKCIRAALHKLQVSRRICSDARSILNRTQRALAGSDVFSIYTGGRCSAGSLYAAHRYNRAQKWLEREPVPHSTVDVVGK
jgi:hypothetical protein